MARLRSVGVREFRDHAPSYDRDELARLIKLIVEQVRTHGLELP